MAIATTLISGEDIIFSNEQELMFIIKLLKSRKIDLKKIRKNAKKTFYEKFYYKKSVKNILNILGNDIQN